MTPFERFWALFGVPRDCLFPLPVEEKAISGLPRNAHDGLFPLPVEEKATSGLPREAQDCPFSDDSGHQLEPLAIAFSPCLSRKRLFQGSLGMLAMAFSLCLSRKRPYRGRSCLFAIAFSLSGRMKRPVSGFLGVTPREASRGPRKWPGSSRAKKLSILTIFAS